MTAAMPPPGLVPDWAAPASVRALVTIRARGVSAGPFGLDGGGPGGLNLGDHVGDDPDAVRENRARLEAAVPGPIRWLQQVHGTAVHEADTPWTGAAPPVADAAVATRPGTVLAVMTADCLPILLADATGRAVGAAHAGWRGLAAGVVEAAVDAVRARAGRDARVLAWLGPAIGPSAFEVGDEVRQAFCELDAAAAAAFTPGPAPGKWWADLFALARLRLAARGVVDVAGGGLCTVADRARFYSHRRDRRSGRFASLVWLAG
ncbi:MAG: peptidoglycan editing factor PgeF [Burkholderiales bacterium]